MNRFVGLAVSIYSETTRFKIPAHKTTFLQNPLDLQSHSLFNSRLEAIKLKGITLALEGGQEIAAVKYILKCERFKV